MAVLGIQVVGQTRIRFNNVKTVANGDGTSSEAEPPGATVDASFHPGVPTG